MSENHIEMYAHCVKCLDEVPEDMSPNEYSALEVGLTDKGIQVWCTRHDCNVVHIDFEGAEHPMDMDTEFTGRHLKSVK